MPPKKEIYEYLIPKTNLPVGTLDGFESIDKGMAISASKYAASFGPSDVHNQSETDGAMTLEGDSIVFRTPYPLEFTSFQFKQFVNSGGQFAKAIIMIPPTKISGNNDESSEAVVDRLQLLKASTLYDTIKDLFGSNLVKYETFLNTTPWKIWRYGQSIFVAQPRFEVYNDSKFKLDTKGLTYKIIFPSNVKCMYFEAIRTFHFCTPNGVLSRSKYPLDSPHTLDEARKTIETHEALPIKVYYKELVLLHAPLEGTDQIMALPVHLNIKDPDTGKIVVLGGYPEMDGKVFMSWPYIEYIEKVYKKIIDDQFMKFLVSYNRDVLLQDIPEDLIEAVSIPMDSVFPEKGIAIEMSYPHKILEKVCGAMLDKMMQGESAAFELSDLECSSSV